MKTVPLNPETIASVSLASDRTTSNPVDADAAAALHQRLDADRASEQIDEPAS